LERCYSPRKKFLAFIRRARKHRRTVENRDQSKQPSPGRQALTRRLAGRLAPTVELPWTTYADCHELLGAAANTSLARLAARRTVVVYFFASTGEEDTAAGTLPGVFRDQEDAISRLGARLVGVSAQTALEQQRLAVDELYNNLLLADERLALADALGPPTLDVAGRDRYEPLTLVLRAGRIAHVFHPASSPSAHVAQVLAWLAQNPAEEEPG
jgi:peroxiredoxin